MVRHPVTPSTGEVTDMTTMDAVATTTTSTCSHPVAATMKWENKDTILHGEKTKVSRVHTQRSEARRPLSLVLCPVENDIADNVL